MIHVVIPSMFRHPCSSENQELAAHCKPPFLRTIAKQLLYILEDLTSDQAPVVFPVWLCGVHLFEFAAHVNLNICFESHKLASNLQFTWVMGPYSESRSCVFVPFTSLRSVIRLNSI